MQCLQLLPRDIEMAVSLLCSKSRDCWAQAPKVRCLGTHDPILHSLSSPGASSSVFLPQCWAISALGVPREFSAVLFSWVCFHTQLSPSSCPRLRVSPEHSFLDVPTKAGWPLSETPACPATSMALLLVTGLTSHLCCWWPWHCLASPARLQCAAANLHHGTHDVFVPLLPVGMHSASLKRSFRAVKVFSSWIPKLLTVLNALLGCRASTSGRSSRESWCMDWVGRCLEVGEERAFVQPGCSKSCWIWE